MNATRRTLLKGVGAAASAMAIGSAGRRYGRAQALAYEAEVIYEFTDFTGEAYTPFKDGYAMGVSSNGTIVGRDVVDGRAVPVTWDLAGTRTLLDTGDIAFDFARNVLTSPNGSLAATLASGEMSIGVRWRDEMPMMLPSVTDPTPSSTVFSVNDNFGAGGLDNDQATRWVNGVPEQMPLADGASLALVSKVSENGDAYGAAFSDDGLIGLPWRWKLAGSLEELPLPEEMSADPLTNIINFNFPAVYDNGDFVLALSMKVGDANSDGVWVAQQGAYTALPTTDPETYATVSAVGSLQWIFGSIAGAGYATGPAVWIDGVPTLLRDVVSMPAGVDLGTVLGVTSDGIVIARSAWGTGLVPSYIMKLTPG